MATGEKTKHFRNLRGVSLETLGQLSGTIKNISMASAIPSPTN